MIIAIYFKKSYYSNLARTIFNFSSVSGHFCIIPAHFCDASGHSYAVPGHFGLFPIYGKKKVDISAYF